MLLSGDVVVKSGPHTMTSVTFISCRASPRSATNASGVKKSLRGIFAPVIECSKTVTVTFTARGPTDFVE